MLIFVAHPGTAPAQAQPSQLRINLRQGIEKAFNLETQSATGLFRKAVELDRENPLGYAFLALAHMFAYEMSFEPKERAREQESMLQDVDEALARGQKRIEKNARDGQAYFAMTLAKIVKIRWAIAQKRYFTILQETAGIWDYLEKAKAEDPQNYDVYFSMGLLHYHLDHLPAAARFFSSLFITAADHDKGLQELELAAQKGDLLKELAQAELVSVYANFEEQPAKALPIAQELKEKFPRNYNFAFALATILSELQRFTEAFAVAGEIERGIQAGSPPFALQLLPRYYHLMGRILFNQKEYARAEEYFPEGPGGYVGHQRPDTGLGPRAPRDDSRHPRGTGEGERVLFPGPGGGRRGRGRPYRGGKIPRDALHAAVRATDPVRGARSRRIARKGEERWEPSG